MLKAVDQCLPTDPADKRLREISDREEIHIKELDCEYFADLGTWYNGGVSAKIKENMPAVAAPMPTGDQPPAAGAPGAPPADPNQAAAAAPPAAPPVEDPGPSGAGWVIQLRGYHYHNKNPETRGSVYVRDHADQEPSRRRNHASWQRRAATKMPIKDLGISCSGDRQDGQPGDGVDPRS